KAVRYERNGRQHARQARRAFDVCRRHTPLADVRRLPGHRHDGKQAGSQHPPSAEMSLAPEEEARANFYALLSRLFYAPPDAQLLQALAGADELDGEDEALAARWRHLIAAA